MRRLITFVSCICFTIGTVYGHLPVGNDGMSNDPAIVHNASKFENSTVPEGKINNPREEKRGYQIRTVVIDPGHGGKDRGCAGRNSREKDIVLQLAHRLGNMMEKEFPDIKVVYTRTEDVFIPLDERAKIANRADADLFISLHCNYIGRSHVNGSETYVLGLHRAEDNLRVAKRENASILLEEDYKSRYDGYDPNSPMSHIILSMYQNAYLDQSIRFAEQVEQAFEKSADRHSRGVKQAGFLVLRETTMPSVLIESGFLSHPKEEAFLLSESGQERMARAILLAFERYKNQLESEELLVGNDQAAEEDSAFFVQLAVTSKKTDPRSPIWNGIPRLNLLQVGDLYKYLSGPYSSRSDAQYWKDKIAGRGFADAFVIKLEGQRPQQLAQNR